MRNVRVHRVAAHLWLDFDLDSPLCVLHRCDVPRCFNPEHLFVGTQKDNTNDMIVKGRARIIHAGEASGAAKLTDAQVRDIRHIRSECDSTYRAIAAMFGITHQNVQDICKRVTWRHVV
jgi:hypothetical protein